MSPWLRARWIADTAREHAWRLRRMGIRPTDFVLDVGAGGSPSLRANVLCEKFADDGLERHGQDVTSDRPLVIGDAAHLPFADKSFDFAICCHLLEHVEDPTAVIRELERVAPRGYIETPDACWEKVQGFAFHRWLVTVEDGVLVFEEKAGPVHDPALRAWFSRFVAGVGTERVWFRRRSVGVYACLTWEGTIPHVVRRAPAAGPVRFDGATLDSTAEPSSTAARGPANRVAGWVGRRLRARSDRPWNAIQASLRCPVCRAPVRPSPGANGCLGCGRVYANHPRGGWPQLLAPVPT